MARQKRRQSSRRAVSLFMAVAMLLSVTFITASPAAAQESIPDGVECVRFDIAPTPDVFVPGGHDVVLLVLEDGTEVLFSDVVDDQRLESPSDSPIVTMYKCDITETVVVPEPEPTPTPEPTPAPEATPEATPAPETTPTTEPEATPTVEPTPAPTTQVNPVPAVEVTPTPSVEVLGAVVERDTLPVTGSGSAEVALVAAALVGVGLLLRRFQTGLAPR